jgi:hypothetical protein
VSDTTATAYHEAGHALGYVHHGRELTEVSIVGTTEHRGITRAAPHLTTSFDLALVSALGPLAQAEHEWRTADPDDGYDFATLLTAAVWDGGRDDYRDSLGLLDSESFVTVYRHVLAEHWAGVERLALALIERGTVPGAEAAELLR